ncbi:bifunctional riboflavin kinase/FAD synthetase [Herminiimonas fonticola]|uniref:Riboflavin biosynthesis protein n=1 Tax=Herminiimonas fonticola TaxID=303380 RepID=A0A4R6G5N6_9BURK|nr:bifunctional riboflavin kinase/FAD synthetase [Herminiimonas fonticola]RBA23766.1 ribF: riboflavin biosynthesis protein RibF [Herminiimonas fonticola]TDN89767.1 riboflavin kinase/FMN adenylyltransferase [Herminiimonas fonticola]
MKVFRGLPNAASRAPCALAIGNFDGVHRGHQALLARLREVASKMGLESAVMTFEPHPREFFAARAGDPSKAPTRIASLRDKLQSLTKAGVDRVIVEHFNEHFASLSPQEFVEKILVQGLHVKWLIVGEDFCYGSKRAGNVATLIEAGKQYGFHVESQPTVTSSGARISSSAVRKALAQGDFAEAEVLLGHPYAMSGHVIHGKKLGRTIGFPTLNLRVAHKHPALSGIYIVQVHGLADEALPGVASIGIRPTVDDSGRVLLETYLFDYNEQCYGRLIRVEFLKKLRDEEKYIDLPTLTEAIERDAVQARAYFKQIADSATSATDRI